jgi:hypothetical protein
MTREEIYRHFGPQLLEALALTIKDEINLLRVKAGLPERTTQQLVDTLETKLNQCPKYDWMDRPII